MQCLCLSDGLCLTVVNHAIRFMFVLLTSCQHSLLTNRMLNQALVCFPPDSARLCYRLRSVLCTQVCWGEKGILNCKRHPGSSWGRRGKLMTELPLCQAGVRRREESVFTNDMICKWSGGGEALRTRWSPRRSVCSSGIRWIKIITSVLCRALFLSLSLLLLSFRAAPVWSDPFCFPICFFFSSPLQYYLPLHPPSSPPTPPSSFSSFPLLLSKIENRTAGNWRSLSLLGPSGFAMPLATAHLCQTIFWSSFCLLFFPLLLLLLP